MRSLLYVANIVAASAYGGVSVLLCANFQLFLPHAVGHVLPAASALVTGLWGLHCWLLGRAEGRDRLRALVGASVPLALSVCAMAVCWLRYPQEYTSPVRPLAW